MPGRNVAGEGDVSATPGNVPFTGAQSGTWTAGSVAVTAHPDLQVGGAAAISQASCVFSFAGVNGGGTAVTGQETVTLTAGGTRLHGDQASVLVDGDEAAGMFGNKLLASSARKLTTA